MKIFGVLLEITNTHIIIGQAESKKIKIRSTILVDLAFLNRHVIVHAKSRQYKFKSTYEYNRGEIIEGTTYTLTQIEYDTRRPSKRIE
jgi:hypothetical protein